MDAKYTNHPYLSGLQEELAKEGISLQAALDGSGKLDSEFVKSAGVKRVEQAKEQGEINLAELNNNSSSTKRPEEYVTSYIVARMIVSIINDPVLIDKFGVAESRFSISKVYEDNMGVNEEYLFEEFGIEDYKKGKDKYEIAYTDYLSSAPNHRGKWSLKARRVHNGYVTVERVSGRNEMKELLKTRIQQRITEDLPLDVPLAAKELLEDEVSEVRGLIQTRDSYTGKDDGEIRPEYFPEPINEIYEKNFIEERDKEGSNKRIDIELYTLVSFLNQLGADEEKINEIVNPDDNGGLSDWISDIIAVNAQPPTFNALDELGVIDTQPSQMDGSEPVGAYYKNVEEGKSGRVAKAAE